MAFGGLLGHVGLRFFVDADPADHSQVERGVGLPVPAAVESVTAGHARGGREWGDAAEHGEAGLRAEPVGVVAGGDQQLAGDLGPDPHPVQELRREGGDQRLDEFVEGGDLIAQLKDAGGPGSSTRSGPAATPCSCYG